MKLLKPLALASLCFSALSLTSCFEMEKEELATNSTKGEFELVEIDSYSFRRAYHGHDTLSGQELERFMNRNPEPNENYSQSEDHPFYAQLAKLGLFQDGNLNIKELDTLPDQFNFSVSQHKLLKVKTKLLEDPDEVETPSFELTFMDRNEIVLMDTLAFDWPPDVTFIAEDLNGDGTEELLSIYRWYIINGDNYDVKMYDVKK
ncbi:MAG: hypothetical protein AB8B56_01085 [Crocinitomicaceae bacterium]